VLDGSPPCQGFSIAGKRQLDDPRNSLAKEFIRLLRGLQPKVFIMENVSGLVKGKMKLVFAEIMKELKASGYQVKCQLMNTMYFNVPQSRERLIWIGVRDNLGIEPKLPEPSNYPFTVRDALINCKIKDYTVPRSYSEWTEKLKPMQSVTDIHPKKFGFNIRKLDWDRPSTTITKTHTPAVGLLHPEDNRYFSIPELMRLGSFPDNFRFQETTTIFMSRQAAWERIGNSVPPLFMKAIAEHIKDEILAKVDMTGGVPELVDS
jgi:DNA (cytosine-5)-methyltransferase 1